MPRAKKILLQYTRANTSPRRETLMRPAEMPEHAQTDEYSF